MDVATWSFGPRRVTPPPLWMLTDGRQVVGPLSTTVLVDGVKAGRVPDTCGARPSTSAKWRALDRIREVRAVRDSLFRRRRPRNLALDSSQALLAISSGEETLEAGLRAAALELSAELGFVHVFDPNGRAVTRHAFGPGARGRVGCPLLEADILSHVARAHAMAVGDVDAHHAFRVAASRLGGRSAEVRGVAMVPILAGANVVAMLELGRSERSFRAADASKLRAIGKRISERV
jgi:hypothetical protein